MVTNLLFISTYTELGGGETALVTLAKNLDHQRFRPHLLVPSVGQLSSCWAENGWPVHIKPWRGATVFFIPPLWARLPLSQHITQLIHEHHIQALHSDYHGLPMALPAAERAGIPALWTCMGWWFHPKPWQRGFFRRIPAILAHSQAIKTGFLGQPPFMPPEKIEVLYPGVDTERFHPQLDGLRIRFETSLHSETPVIALIARFQDVKGHEVFQEMAKQVTLQVPQVRFLVAGENTQSEADNRYKQQILANARAEPLLRKRLIYLGFRPDVEQVIGAADIVVCSSHFEGYGMVNIEAMACGKPVVSTNQGGPSETIVDGETGFLVSPNDPAALASRVIQLLRDPTLREAMGAAGRARVEQHFSGKSNGIQFTRTLDRLL